MNNWVCIGDSLTWGKWTNGSPTKNLTNRLSEKFPKVNIVNLGVNSQDTADINARKADADVYNPFRVMVWIGINDVANSVTANTIKTTLQTIYTYYSGKGYEVWAVTITPRDDNSAAKVAVRDNVNNWITNTATGVDRVIDAFTVIADPSNTVRRLPAYADPYSPNHLTDAGYAAIIETI